jgi:hypothetical protein
MFEAFKVFKAFVELQYGMSIGCLHSNKGGKFIGHILIKSGYLSNLGDRQK